MSVEVDEWPSGLGRYRILSMIGRGGSAVVYRGRDDELCRDVAIKVLHRRLVNSALGVELFLKEARNLARVDHPHIVPVYDVGRTADGLCYLVTKQVEGTDLKARLQESRLPREEAVARIAAVAEALHHAHQQGLVHRDVKPGNILLDSAGNTLLADFGLALRAEEFGTGPSWVGTVTYMSPEQARREGHRVDARTDIYSLGVILYEALTGRRQFEADSREELIEKIKNDEPRSPRQLDPGIPAELERICLRALARRTADRYATAEEMAADLRDWLRADASTASSPAGSDRASACEAAPVKVVPRGLRAYGDEDADFFIDLLPGPRNRDGLPDSIAFWKSRIESVDAEKAFRVGLLYGPSGSGKSSLVKAGLLPRLARHVHSLYVEAAPGLTTAHLLLLLQRRFPQLPRDGGLVQMFLHLRQGQGLPGQEKLLIVLDQFEQWLHGAQPHDHRELLDALRQCDGVKVQCLFLARYDFWLSIGRFMHDLEVPLVETQNLAQIDLFDTLHAGKVLAEFGRAYGRLPEPPAFPTAEQQQFLDEAVSGLAEDGRVVPVRLAVFAEMVKGRPWVPATLRAVGGTEGIGAVFLDEMLSATHAPAAHRQHEQAARQVLQALLPEPGSDLKGALQPATVLRDRSGYGDQPHKFAALMRMLDGELRLISPTTVGLLDPDTPADRAAAPAEASYQLSHDYLVPALRNWLTQKQRETMRGRAQLRLEARAAWWIVRPESRRLPAWWEWVGIRLYTARARWTPPQQRMMRVANRYFRRRMAVAVCLLALALLGGWRLFHGWLAYQRDQRADVLLAAIRDPDSSLQDYMQNEVRHNHAAVMPKLLALLDDPTANDHERLRVRLLLLPDDPRQLGPVMKALPTADIDNVLKIRKALMPYRGEVSPELWQQLDNTAAAPGQRLRAAAVLAAFEPKDAPWGHVGTAIAAILVTQDARDLDDWVQALHPLREHLIVPLTRLFKNRKEPAHGIAAAILANYAADQPALLVDLLLDASAAQFATLWPAMASQPQETIPVLEREFGKVAAVGASDADRERLAKRKAQAAVALLRLGQDSYVWPLLRRGEELRVRSFLIQRLASLGVNPWLLVRRFHDATDLSERRALLLSLGTMPPEQLPPDERQPFLDRLLTVFRDEPDPGMHAAAEWLLRRWGHEKQVERNVRALAARRPHSTGSMRWYVNGQDQTMVVIPGPVEFWMGSPAAEPDRRDNEDLHLKRIGRSFAIAAKPVTFEQFERFHVLHPEIAHDHQRHVAHEPSSPVGSVTWLNAVRYCRWLSEQEKVPEEQMCYPPIKEIKADMKLPANFLERTGYRLPTEAEWEYSCRAGSTTSRYYGSSVELLGHYACYVEVSGNRSMRVGSLKPNDLGLFDMHGNVWNWCQDVYDQYPSSMPRQPVEDQLDAAGRANPRIRVMRSGAFDSPIAHVRCAYRNWDEMRLTEVNVGMRVARTWR